MIGQAGSMVDALRADQVAASLASKLVLYGRFAGSWHLDVNFFDGGVHRRVEGELHVGWVLGGKAIQDVWIYPTRALRATQPAEAWHTYGSTLRWYDPAIDAWHITWFEPSRFVQLHQIGRAVGSDIVQIGEDPHGLFDRWRFVEIADETFTWLGEKSWDQGATWTLIKKMIARKAHPT